MLLSNIFKYLGKYLEFHKLYNHGDFYAAASFLLLSFFFYYRLAPKECWITLLIDNIPLIEARGMDVLN